MSFTTFVSMVSTADNSKLFLNNFYKLLKLKLFVYISQLRKSIPCGSIYSGRGGGITFCLQKGEPMRETAYWVGGEIFWATKGEAWERTKPCVWRNMIHNKTEESLEQTTYIRLGGKQQKLGLGHNTCWRNMIHNKTEQSLEQTTSIRLGGKQQKLGLGHITHVEEIWYST